MNDLRFVSPSVHVSCPAFRKRFFSGGVRRALLTITGLGLYRAFLNGQRLGEDYLSPGLNDYGAYLRAASIDITSLIRRENELLVVLGDGWYMGRYGIGGSGDNRKVFGSQYLLGAQILLEGVDGKINVIDTDTGWECGTSPILFSDIYDGEVRDDNQPYRFFMTCKSAEPPAPVELNTMPPVREVARFKPKLIISPKGEKILDFGQNIAGIVRFVNRLPKGGNLRLRHGEVLQEGCFYNGNLRSARAEYRYVSDGVIKEVEPWFTFYGFRYVLVEGMDQVDPQDFTGVALMSQMRETLRINTASSDLNQLMSNTFWSQRSNFLEIPTDCPQRDERLGWTGDAQVFCATACYQMDSKAFFSKYLRDLRYEQVEYYGGDIPMYCPSLRGEAGVGGAAWADAATIIPWQLYQHYGDVDLLREHYPLMRDYARKLIGVDLKDGKSHLVRDGFAFGDWLGLDGVSPTSFVGGTEKSFIQSVYCMLSLGLASSAARVLGLSEDHSVFSKYESSVRAALKREYLTPGGRLSVDTQTGYALALHHGLYTNVDVLKNQFLNRLRLDSYCLKTGFVGTSIILPALLDHGMVEEAYRLLFRREYPGWLYPVAMGATTIWERWNSLLPDGKVSDTGMNSFNHYASGAVCTAIYSRIVGLSPMAPGWTVARIAPQPNWRLKYADMAFNSPVGIYKVSWRIEDNGDFALKVQVPEGAVAHVVLPYHPDHAQMRVRGGATYAYQPTVDMVRPFSVDSLTADLMGHQGAADKVKEYMPSFYGALMSGNQDFRMMSPRQAMRTLPFLRDYDMDALNAALREVRA